MSSDGYDRRVSASEVNRQLAAESLVAFIRDSRTGFQEPTKSHALAIIDLIAASNVLQRARPESIGIQISTTKPKS